MGSCSRFICELFSPSAFAQALARSGDSGSARLRPGITPADADGFEGTDTAACLERYAGTAVYAVPSTPMNLKVTFPEDVVDSEPIDEQSRARRLQAMQLVSYKLNQLADHVNGSRCVLNDLRTLRRLVLRERALGMKSMKSVRSMKP